MSRLLDERQMNEIVEFATQRSRDADFGHTMKHIDLTVALARQLAAREGADEEMCVVAAYLHDIAKNNSQSHGTDGAEEARVFLERLGTPGHLIDQVCYAISQHDNDQPKLTLEAKILWDADKLQSVGPLGFARIFANRLIYVKKDVYYAIEQAKVWEEFFLQRFYTDTGRSAAVRLHRFMEEFFQLCDEVRDARLDRLLDDGVGCAAVFGLDGARSAIEADRK